MPLSPYSRESRANFFFTRTLVIPRTDSGPSGQVCRRGKHLHVYTNLRYQFLGPSLVNARDCTKTLYFCPDRFATAVNLCLKLRNLLFKARDAPTDGLQHELVMLRETAFHRIEEQTRLTDTVHQLALSIRDLANKQEHIQQDVQRIRGDVDELKGKPGKHWDAVALELIKSALLAAAGYFLARLY